jgi:hypothetical protein
MVTVGSMTLGASLGVVVYQVGMWLTCPTRRKPAALGGSNVLNKPEKRGS